MSEKYGRSKATGTKIDHDNVDTTSDWQAMEL